MSLGNDRSQSREQPQHRSAALWERSVVPSGCSHCRSDSHYCSHLLFHSIQLVPARQHSDSSDADTTGAAANHALQPAIVPRQYWSVLRRSASLRG